MKSHLKLLLMLMVLFVMMRIITAGIAGTVTESKPVTIYCPQRKLALRKFGDKYYYLGAHFKLNWFQAFFFCRRHTMELVTISSKEVDANVGKLLTESGLDYGRFWTSGSDLGERGKYHWLSNGELIIFTKWAPDQPDNARNDGVVEHCIELASTDDGQTFLWNDAVCNIPQYFICEV